MRRMTGLVLAMLWAACGARGTPPVGPHLLTETEAPARPWWGVSAQATTATDTPVLTGFSGASACQALEQQIEDRAVLQMHLDLEANRAQALQSWRWQQEWKANGGTGGWYGWSGGSVDAGSTGMGGASGSSGATPSAGPQDFTTTTTQYATVDEADFVKNDGTRLFVLSGRDLHTVSTWPASALARRGSLRLEGTPREMFLDGNRLVVFSQVLDARLGRVPTWCSAYTGSSGWSCEQVYGNGTLVTWVDVSDLAHPVVVSTSLVPGRYVSARRVATTVRLVTSSGEYEGLGVDTWLPWQQQQDAQSAAELSGLFDELEARNVATLRGRTLADWLPPAWRGVGDTATPVPVDCSEVLTTSGSARLGVASVVTLDTQDPAPLQRTLLLASVDELSMSQDMLIVAQRHWWWNQPWVQGGSSETSTYLYAFDTRSKGGVTPLGAGRVLGMPVDQFAIDETAGIIRLAVTETTMGPGFSVTNRVLTLAPDGQGRLVELGRTAALSPGERVMSARFVGETAYVVTFRQTDPFFVVDLSNPRAPAVVGELRIPGFSSYLHPMDATHVLAVGTYIPAQPTTWNERALQIAVFDVSDKAHPRQQHQVTVGTGYSWSEAQWDHKAFNYFAQKGLLALPFFDWSYTQSDYGTWSYTSDLRVFKVDTGTGITALGTLQMKDLLQQPGCTSDYGCWGWSWYPMVRRSVMADDFVYAISSGGVRVASVTDLATPLATTTFPFSP